jgi:hypothetical protein
MTNIASTLLDFILDLLRDPETAREFTADPEGTLAAAGLADVCPDDVHTVLPMLADFAPAAAVAAVPAAAAAASPTFVAGAVRPSGEASAVEQIRYIQTTYSYQQTTEIDASNGVWADGDLYQVFGEEVVVATGGSLVAGGDIEDARVDNSTDNSVAVDIEDSFNPEDSFNTDIDLENSGNTVRGDGNAVGEGNDVDNSDRSVDVDVDDSFNGNALGDGSAVHNGDALTVDDVVLGNGNVQGNGNTVGNDVEDAFNESTETTTIDTTFTDSFDEESIDVELDDVVLGSGSADDVDVDVDVADSGNGNFAGNVTDSAVADDGLAIDDPRVDF